MPSVDQWVSFAACLAAFIAALATFWTVREMARQRQASFMPELVINGRMVSLRTRYDTQQKHFEFHEPLQLENDTIKPEPYQSVRIINIGLGSAKRIRANWIIDVNKLAKEINKVAAMASIDTRLRYDTGLGTLMFEGKDTYAKCHMAKNQVGGQWNYLMPASVDEKGIELVIPPFFIEACLFGLTAVHKGDLFGKAMEGMEDQFVAGLDLSYLDIQDNSYRKSLGFEFKMLLSDMKPADETDKDEVFNFTMMFKEIGTELPLRYDAAE